MVVVDAAVIAKSRSYLSMVAVNTTAVVSQKIVVTIYDHRGSGCVNTAVDYDSNFFDYNSGFQPLPWSYFVIVMA